MMTQSTHIFPQKFLIASIIPKTVTDEEAFYNLKETSELVKSYGGKVAEYVLQKREVHDKGLYLGTGKIKEINDIIFSKKIDVVILNDIVKPGHIFDIKKSLHYKNPKIEVWDRIDLILQIFLQHADTTEARLQIELAAMKHMGPRIYGMGHVLSRQGGSIGTRGIGETNTELMKRHWRKQVKNSEQKLQKIHLNKMMQIERRKRLGIYTISLVGYTNAGKSSVFTMLTGKSAFIKDALFATLDSKAGEYAFENTNKKILITDTIGFIRNLPASLIKAFNSTLLESIHSDLLLHIVDSSDDDMEFKIKIVDRIVNDLTGKSKPMLLVFNKLDLISKKKQTEIKKFYATRNPIFVSTKDNYVSELVLSIKKELHLVSL